MALLHAWALLAMLPMSAADQPGAPTPKDAAVRKELTRLQGSWQIEDFEEDGKKASPEELKTRSVFFGRDTFMLRGADNLTQIGILKLQPAKSPKAADAVIVRGPNKDTIMLGIYAFEGDTLKVCFDVQGEERPKDFSTVQKSGRLLLVCKRIPTKDSPSDLSGAYRSVTTEIDGSKHAAAVNIERMGDAYLITYLRNQGVAYVGIGLRKGNVFCMSWISQGQAGVTLYQIESGPRLVGQYTQLGGPGILSDEVLTRIGNVD